ncbi:glycoside hydrolase family 88 protein [Cohnella rhizosphaerae]|uniref:Glycoside hydrolase family 88 protein n=1 Tax=Cohnella rhizosphaerae TaxID=1457232 RepID=A0A9X4QSC6_9BACL|nr:glycoside hydrolase family 88 protein [Cohnella rhizosphaerae]MDG0809951.1 glycoside hydrolase family 88 protein [Cohnella rhizosphaerae]
MSEWNAAELLARLERKVDRMIAQFGDRCPHFAGKDGIYDDMGTDWWTSGFWGGLLWVMYGATGEARYREAAWHWDETIERWFVLPTDQLNHDVGFQFLPTAVIKHTATGDADGCRRGLAAANFLAGRFNPAGGFIRAWNGDKYGWAIVDCMMNIPLLFWATQITGDPRYKHIALLHADTSLRYSVRDDGSVNHIVSFDPESGEYLGSIGGQGNAPDSAWSRGTAWGLYGFAAAYGWTGDVKYLNAAKRIAHFFVAALPDDLVPYWDFRLDTAEGEPRDSSAAAIAASGLLDIASSVPPAERGIYLDSATRILASLTANYGTWDRPEHEGILIAATGHKPGNGCIDGSLVYGDYFYVEAVAKLNGWRHRVFGPQPDALAPKPAVSV